MLLAWGFEMLKDERDVVEVLKSELEYLRNGSYSERESWGPGFIFEDSPTCLNFGHRDNPSPCSGCVLMDFVPPEHRSQKFPCRHIPLDASGQTLDGLYRHCDQGEVEEAVCNWLQVTIQRLEEEREVYLRKTNTRPSVASGGEAPVVVQKAKAFLFMRGSIPSVQTLCVRLHFIGSREGSFSDSDLRGSLLK